MVYLERYGSLTAMQHYRQIMEAENGRQVQLGILLREEGILDRIQHTQAKYLSAALQALGSLRTSAARKHLGLFASYAVDIDPIFSRRWIAMPRPSLGWVGLTIKRFRSFCQHLMIIHRV